ncbi:MAG: hypothetical protein IPO59_22135 [Betaproteobacteria bacterium]|nr:hypothetical protein [Betaproteobacteria bacterium]
MATLQAQVAELELVQVDATRQQVSARLASLDEPVARLRNEVDRVRGQQRLDDADLKRLLQEISAEGRSLAAERVRLAEQLARSQAGDTGNDSALARTGIAAADLGRAARTRSHRTRPGGALAQPPGGLGCRGRP